MKLVASTAALLAGALCFIPSALAANIAPNPSFTSDCSGVPCGWERTNTGTGSGGRPIAVVTRDTSTFASTPASIQVQTGPIRGEGARTTACITSGVGNGNYSLGYSYRVADNDVQQIGAQALFYADNACDPGGQNGFIDLVNAFVDKPAGGWTSAWITLSPVADTITGNPLSARIFLTVRPTDACDANPNCTSVANFDDVILDSSVPTAVNLRSAAAYRSPAGVVLRWRTAAEIGTLGFNVYRERAGKRQRMNRVLIPSGRGFYSFVDRLAPRKTKLRYWIEEVALDGRRSWHGPLRVGF